MHNAHDLLKKEPGEKSGGQDLTYWQDTGRVNSRCGPAESQKGSHVLIESSFRVGDTVTDSPSHKKALKENTRKNIKIFRKTFSPLTNL